MPDSSVESRKGWLEVRIDRSELSAPAGSLRGSRRVRGQCQGEGSSNGEVAKVARVFDGACRAMRLGGAPSLGRPSPERGMASEAAIGSESQQAIAMLFAQPKLAGNSAEVELACGGSRRRARCRLFNEPVSVKLLTIVGMANDCREVVPHAGRYFL